MSREKVGLVRAVYERWGAGDFQASVELFDPHVVFIIPSELPDAGVYVGTERIAEYTRGFLEPWERITLDAEELTQEGDSVIAAVVQRGMGRQSGAATELRYFQVWTFRGDRVIRLENLRDRAKAFAAAGLRE
jgi:ketosteroid isomerase-like protein